jgi:hypothetical protein
MAAPLEGIGLSGCAWPIALVGGLLMTAPRLRMAMRNPGAMVVPALTALVICFACLLATMPVGDDWSYAVTGRDGWIAAQLATWNTWSGRYSATALLTGWPQILPMHGGYPFVATASAAVAVSGWCVLAWVLTPAALPRGHRLGLITLAGLGLLAGLPSLAEGGAWLAGSLTYTLPSGCAAWGWALLLRGRELHWRGPIAVLALALAAGGNELTAAIDAGLLALVTGLMLWQRDPRRGWFVVAAVVALGCLLLSYVAPGNVMRREAVLEGRLAPGLGLAVVDAWSAGLDVLIAGCTSAGLCAIALVVLAARCPGPRPPGWLAPVLVISSVLIAAALQVPSVAATGWACPPRAANLVWLAAWSCLAAACISAGLRLAGRMPNVGLAGHLTSALPPAAVLLAFLGSGSLARATGDVVLLPRHAAAISERRLLLTQAQPGSDLDLPLLDPDLTPRSCLAYDLTPWRGDWSNRACATWHGLASVRIIAPKHLRPQRGNDTHEP